MANRAPKEIVTQDFGGRDSLITKLSKLLEDKDATAKLQGLTNSKLLVLHKAASEVATRFQTKANLVKQIAEKKFAPHAPDSAYIEKISAYSPKRLLDLYRRVS